MLSYTTFFLTLTTLLPLTTCHPNTPRSTGVIHRIFAGSTTANAGLHFEPENVVAEIGDLIEFHFLPKNHSVVQSSFDAPCEPLGGDSAVFSGFNFKTDAGESDKVFSFVVKDTLPFWYYCSQPTGEHCKKGMSGVVSKPAVRIACETVTDCISQRSDQPEFQQ
jgi:plastocyanin